MRYWLFSNRDTGPPSVLSSTLLICSSRSTIAISRAAPSPPSPLRRLNQCERHQRSSSFAPYGPMDDGCEGVDGRDVFVQASFNLADFRTAAAGAGDIEDGDPGDRNARDQRGAHDALGGQRSCWRWGKEVAQDRCESGKGRSSGLV